VKRIRSQYEEENELSDIQSPMWLPEEYHEWWRWFALSFPISIASGWKVSIPAFKIILRKYHYDLYVNIFGEWKNLFDRMERAKNELEIILSPYVEVEDIRIRDQEIVIVLDEQDEYIDRITPKYLYGIPINLDFGEIEDFI
jgi:hypothetical protein